MYFVITSKQPLVFFNCVSIYYNIGDHEPTSLYMIDYINNGFFSLVLREMFDAWKVYVVFSSQSNILFSRLYSDNFVNP